MARKRKSRKHRAEAAKMFDTKSRRQNIACYADTLTFSKKAKKLADVIDKATDCFEYKPHRPHEPFECIHKDCKLSHLASEGAYLLHYIKHSKVETCPVDNSPYANVRHKK